MLMRRRIFGAVLGLAGLATTALAADSEIRIGAVSSRPEAVHLPSADVAAAVTAQVAILSGPNATLAGRAVRVIALDDTCTRERGIETASAIVAQRVHVVIGHVCAPAAVAAAPIYAAAGILFMAPGVRHTSLTTPRAGPLVFRLAGRNDRLAVDVALTAQRRFANARSAIVHDKSAQSRAIAGTVGRTLTVAGLRPIHEEAFASGEKTYAALIAKLASLTIDLVFIPAQAPELAIMLRDAATMAPSMKFIGGESLAVPYIESTAASDPDRLILMLPWPDRVFSAVNASGNAHPATPPRPAEALARAAVEAWAHAAARAGSVGPRDVAHFLTTETAPTHAGPIRFDGNGDAEVPSFTPHAWRDGRWSPLEDQRPLGQRP
jgi:branched-chain amino acid transport system substrate-binding protein